MKVELGLALKGALQQMVEARRRSAVGTTDKLDGQLGAFTVLSFTVIAGAISAYTLHANVDVGWVVNAGIRLSRGAILYRDVFDVHPPLLFWFSAVTAYIAALVGADPTLTYKAFVFLHVLVGIVLSRMITASWTLPAGLSIALLPLAGFDFGEGEQLFVAGFVPYLLLAVERLRERPVNVLVAGIAGLIVGMGVARKPHLGLAWLMVEAVLIHQCGWRRALRRPELRLVLATGLLYLVSVIVFAPGYLQVARWAAQGYGGHYPVGPVDLLRSRFLWQVIGGAGLLLLFRRTHETWIVVGAALLLTLAVFIQGHGWPYHWFPARAVILTLLLAPLLRRRWVTAPTVALIGAWPLWLSAQFYQLRVWPFMMDRTREVVAEYGGPVLALSTLMHATYPMVNEMGTFTTSRFPTMWPVAAAYDTAGFPFPYRARLEMSDFERYAFDAIIEDFLAGAPQVVFVDTLPPRPPPWPKPMTGFNWIEYLGQDQRFREMFSQYREIEQIANYRVFVREKLEQDREP